MVVAAVALGAAVTPAVDGPGEAPTANLWVNTAAGRSPARCSRPCEYEPSRSYGSFAAAYSAASGGDTIRVKAGTYPAGQSVGGKKTPAVTLVGEEGTTVESGRLPEGLRGLSLAGNVTVGNVDVGGDEPFVFIGSGSTWRDSRLLESSDADDRARGCCGATPEPILIYRADEGPTLRNAAMVNVVVEPQHVCTPGVGGCPAGDVYHLESVRIDGNVDGVLLDRVTFADGGEDNTALVFITRQGDANPRNITIQNSVFGEHAGSANIDGGGNGVCRNWTLAYNTLTKPASLSCQPGSRIRFIGNAGPFASYAVCTAGATYARNVWQWSSDPRHCPGQPENDSWAPGPDFGIDALGLDAHRRPGSGSVVIDAGERGDAPTHCTGELGGVDRDGRARPQGGACDAGAYEAG
jgi:hypothetical protein